MSRHPSSRPRRSFLQSAATLGVASAAGPVTAAANNAVGTQPTIQVGVMGLSRGLAVAKTFAALPGVRVRTLCDTDALRLKSARESLVEAAGDDDIRTTADFREMLADPEIDVLVCAAPNHWHAPASIQACDAGKHVYVEKPCSHNPWEGELLVRAARRNNRCVQMGNQRRSGDAIIEAINLLHEGAIGRVYYSRSWYANLRGPIGTGKPADVPPHIDYELWQGPAPRQPFTSNRLHYNWHWVWHYGNGELGNNGIHSIDLSRWGLQVDYPTRVTSSGGRYRFDDDQQTADTHMVCFEFPGERQIIWEGLSCNRDGMYGDSFGVSFHGEKGSLRMSSWGYKLYDERAREIGGKDGRGADSQHAANLIAAIRANDPSMLNSEIEEGHKSTLLCHLGNIAHRTGDTIRCDPANGHIQDNAAAEALWRRDYEPGWEPATGDSA